MDFNGRQPLQSLYDSAVGQLQRIFYRFAFDHFSGHGAGGDGGAAAKGFELDVFNHAVFDLQVHFHDIAAFGVAYFPYTVGILNFAYVAGVGEMVHDFFRI